MKESIDLWGDLKWEAILATCFKRNPDLPKGKEMEFGTALVCVTYCYREVFPEAYGVGVLEYDGVDTNANSHDLREVETQADCWAPRDDVREHRMAIPFHALRPANDAEISAYLLRLEA